MAQIAFEKGASLGLMRVIHVASESITPSDIHAPGKHPMSHSACVTTAIRRRDLSDLTDHPWAVIAPMIPDATPGGRPRKADRRKIVEAILYSLRAGCAWRLLSHALPTWQTVCYYLRRWRREDVWAGVLHTFVMADRSGQVEKPLLQRRSSAARLSGRPRRRKAGFLAKDKTHVALEILRRMSWRKGYVVFRQSWSRSALSPGS